MTGYKNIFFRVSGNLLKYFSLDSLIKSSGQKFIIPLYHCVSDIPPDHLRYLYPVKSIKDFEKDLDFILKYYKPVLPDDLKSIIINGGRVSENTFILTFDDGLREFYEVIAPILFRKGIPAICFLNSAFIGNKDMFYRYKASILTDYVNNKNIHISKNKFEEAGLSAEEAAKLPVKNPLLSLSYHQKGTIDKLAIKTGCNFEQYLSDVKPYMNKYEIEELIQKGFLFGAHSIDHPLFSEIEESEQLKQTIESMNFVQSTFDLDYRYYAFPFTDTGVKQSFFKKLYSGTNTIDISFGTSGLKKDRTPHHWQRIPMESNNLSAEKILKSEYLYYLMKGFTGRNTIRRS
ncbi:MAG: polysaccharide deacetylase family protein [Saprospiraceae bacterium]|nr:polysaccharide deacetylase family protein [Saprospiraceae bacterium]